jgi:uncharacterized protein YfcZ (UPF0381/DUF406 family)
MRCTATLSYKYASDAASQDNCEAYLSFCESNDTLPRDPFTVISNSSPCKCTLKLMLSSNCAQILTMNFSFFCYREEIIFLNNYFDVNVKALIVY